MARINGQIQLELHLELPRCPHCSVDRPNLKRVWKTETAAHNRPTTLHWGIYVCSRCGCLTTALCVGNNPNVQEIFPGANSLDNSIPDPAREFLQQASDSLHSPAGAVMLAASAVDAMLKAKNYKEGVLYTRINKAAEDHLITLAMANWAHQVRLDANDQRHADEAASLPSTEDARRSIHFAQALAEFLFTLPNRVTRGLKESASKVERQPSGKENS